MSPPPARNSFRYCPISFPLPAFTRAKLAFLRVADDPLGAPINTAASGVAVTAAQCARTRFRASHAQSGVWLSVVSLVGNALNSEVPSPSPEAVASQTKSGSQHDSKPQRKDRKKITYILRGIANAPQPMKRKLTLLDAVFLIVGCVIGAGVFVAPNLVARQAHTGPWILAAWLCAGVLALFGALAVAELGGMIPGNGGLYLYLKAAYGPLWGFLAGWTTFLILYSGALAWLAVSFTIYLRAFIPVGQPQARAIGACLIAFFALVNVRGIRLAANAQDALTFLKVLGILVVIAAAWLAPARVADAATPAPPALSGFGLALIGCLLTYDGWILVSFIAAEVENPQRNVPRALFLDMASVIVLYILANAAYLRVLSPAEIAAADRVGAEAARRALGAPGADLVVAVTLLSIAGAINGILLATARLYQRMSRDGLFFGSLAGDHPRFGTPAAALVAKAGWSILLVVTGTYESLASYAMFAAYIFYTLMAVAVIVLRRRQPDRPRPYRMWGYPLTPLLFAGAGCVFVGNTLRQAPGPALAALGLIALGLPAYWFWSRYGSTTKVSY